MSCAECLVQAAYPDSKIRKAYMGPTWGRQDTGGPHVGPMNLAIGVAMDICVGELGQHCLVMVMACRLFCAKPFFLLTLTY